MENKNKKFNIEIEGCEAKDENTMFWTIQKALKTAKIDFGSIYIKVVK